MESQRALLFDIDGTVADTQSARRDAAHLSLAARSAHAVTA